MRIFILILLLNSALAASLTVAIPVREASSEHVPRLLVALAAQTLMPQETLLLLPREMRGQTHQLKRMADQYKTLNVKIVSTTLDAKVVVLKNETLSRLKTDVVVYIEPEVLPHRRLLELVARQNADVLLFRWTPEDYLEHPEFYSEAGLLLPDEPSGAFLPITKVSDFKQFPQVKFGTAAFKTTVVKSKPWPKEWEMIGNWQNNEMKYIFSLVEEGKSCLVHPEPLLTISRPILDDHY